MRRFITLTACAILLSGCGEHVQNKSALVGTIAPGTTSSPTPKATGSPAVQASGPVLQCLKCVFFEEKGVRYIAGQIHNDGKEPVNGYVMAIDLLDGKGQSIKKIPGLMLMTALPMEAGATKEFEERVLSAETNVTQAIVYLKKSGTGEKLSKELTLKLTVHK